MFRTVGFALAGTILLALSWVAVPAVAEPSKWKVVKRLEGAPSYPYTGPSIAVLGPRNVWVADGPIQHWNGRRWREVRPKGSGDTRFIGVVAASKNDIWFITEVEPTYQGVKMVHWNGRRWRWLKQAQAYLSTPRDVTMMPNGDVWWTNTYSAVRLRKGKQKTTYLDQWVRGIAGRSSSDLWAIGSEGQGPARPLAAHWNGKRWRNTPVPKIKHGMLNAVAVVSSKDVWAVGEQWTGVDPETDELDTRPLAMHWNGRSWRTVRTAGLGLGSFNQAAPDGRGGIWVGFEDRLAHYSGGRWKTVRTPLGGDVSELVRVPGTKTLWGTVNGTEHALIRLQA